jgi:hypothetical protein
MFPLVSFPFLLVYSANPRLILARKAELPFVHLENSDLLKRREGRIVK